MDTKKFRKLHVNLPHQPLVRQGPWLVAGVLLAIIVLLIVAFAYFGLIR